MRRLAGPVTVYLPDTVFGPAKMSHRPSAWNVTTAGELISCHRPTTRADSLAEESRPVAHPKSKKAITANTSGAFIGFAIVSSGYSLATPSSSDFWGAPDENASSIFHEL